MPDTSEEPKLIVLRYRDLVTTPGETIPLHSNIIQKSGFVWWGWWNKPGETIPVSSILRLRKSQEEEGSTKIILFDSGKLELRFACCIDIKWHQEYKRLEAPDQGEYTPLYYKDKRYLIWFKFNRIEPPLEEPDKELLNYSYAKDDELFDNHKSYYTRFHDKRVYSREELKQQDRSMWLLRKKRKGDAVNEISLVQGSELRPDHFVDQYICSQSRHLLWVSDLHFGPNHGFPSETSISSFDLGQAIESAAGANGIEDLAGVIISGDITWNASEEDFNDAIAFFQRLGRSPSKLDNYRFAICPGNHDLRFSPAPEDKTSKILDSAASSDARKNYEKMYEEMFYIPPNEFLSLGRRFLLGGHFPVEVVCLNSSLLDQKQGWFQGIGYLSQRQLDHAAQEFGWRQDRSVGVPDDSPRAFRIVVMHHHLLPVSFAEEPIGGMQYSTVLDAERLARWLCRHRVNVLLHGHMHQPYYAMLKKPIDHRNPQSIKHDIHVIGLGSTGVNQAHRGEFSNMFGIITAGSKTMKFSIYEIFPGTEEPREYWSLEVDPVQA
ncbi:MAG: metallophosphoesterase family protein [Cyanobacteriota bacterium]|jgi:hypothetical protein